MSMPTIPDISANIDITPEDSKSIILASIGFMELSLAHILNAQGEKIQSFLGTLECQEVNPSPSIEDLQILDQAVNEAISHVKELEEVLLQKLEKLAQI